MVGRGSAESRRGRGQTTKDWLVRLVTRTTAERATGQRALTGAAGRAQHLARPYGQSGHEYRTAVGNLTAAG